jgi:hypothetical protein
LYSISFFRTGNGVEIIIFSFKRPIRAEVATYRLDVVFGFLHTKQLRGFDEEDQQKSCIILSVRIILQFSNSSTSPKKSSEWKMAKMMFFGRSDGGQDNLSKAFPNQTR